MTKIYTYFTIMLGLSLLFYFTGLTTECRGDLMCEANAPSSALLNIVLRPSENITNSWYSIIAIAIAGIATASAIIVGFSQNNPELAGRGVVGSLLLLFGLDFISIYNVVKSANQYIAAVLFLPLIAIFILVVLDWTGKYG